MDILIQTVFNGVVASAVYFLIAAGITFVFGLTKLINFAHGQFFVLAMFVAYELTRLGLNFFVAAAAAIVVGALLGYLSERLLFRFTSANPYNGLIVGLGLLLVLEAVALKIWGGFPVRVPASFSGGFGVGSSFFSYNRITVLAIAVALAAVLFRLLKSSRLGQQLQAAHENPVAAAHVGINVGRMVTYAFIVGSGLAGLGGVLLGTLQPMSAFDGHGLIIKGFAVALLGGLGNLSGAMKASVLYGVGETLVASYLIPDFVPIFTYGVIIVVLVFRPGGLFEKGQGSEQTFSRNSIGRIHRQRDLTRGERLTVLLVALACAPMLFELAPDSHAQALLVVAALYAVQVYALSYVYETTGILSIAQAGLMLVGAYTGGVLAMHLGLGFWWALLVAVPVTALFGGALGFIVARCTGHYLLLTTLAFSALLYQVALTAQSLTNGDNGIILAQELPSFGPFGFESLREQFYVIAVAAALAVGGLAILRRTRYGRQLLAIRENESLARSLGLRVGFLKTTIFALSGVVSAVGGVLYLYSQRVIAPASFETALSIEIVIMLVLGGRGLLGPAIGAVVFVVVPELLGLTPIDQQLVFGAGLIAVILLSPDGFVPTFRAGYNRLVRMISRRPAETYNIVDPAPQVAPQKEVV
ncbi:ABC transporter permease [Acrocarpospora macrocephala]|uniref:ABC transporter permease n=1 Tax=Acrocarpospora macrocephala TaxID=150177 RepID=A0A5M3X0U7_9ACTN|nr:ABC transporter permease [Acrocarpospora macrocephala]GES14754.1 ABC transporter permease [Acrocarpospora macrocephala]